MIIPDINLLLYALRSLSNGGQLSITTAARTWTGPRSPSTASPTQLKVGENVVVAELECAFRRDDAASITDAGGHTRSAVKPSGLGLTVLKKIVELYGGAMESSTQKGVSSIYSVIFRV